MQITVAMIERFLDRLPHLQRYRGDIIGSARAAVGADGNIPVEKIDGVMGVLTNDFFDYCCKWNAETGIVAAIVGEDEVTSI